MFSRVCSSYAQVLVQLMVAASIDGPLHQQLATALPFAPLPPLDFTRATLAQRKAPVVLQYAWR
jgi:hypothetical protein